jgi:hypothetical protein
MMSVKLSSRGMRGMDGDIPGKSGAPQAGFAS